MIYIVVYTPLKSNMVNDRLVKTIREYSSWVKLNTNTYLVDTGDRKLTSYDIRKNLLPLCDAGDKLFVGWVTKNASWVGYENRIFTWIKMHDQDEEENDGSIGTCDSKSMNTMSIRDMIQNVGEREDRRDTVRLMVGGWLSIWDNNKMCFTCDGVADEKILNEFIGSIFLALKRPMFLSKIKLAKYPKGRENILRETMNEFCLLKGEASFTDEEFDGLFIADMA